MDGPLSFARDAMATTFEIVIAGQPADYAHQAADAAFDECARVEHEISRFVPTSDVARFNDLRPGESLRVGPDLWRCLRVARRVHRVSGGRFDVTIGDLPALWRSGEPDVLDLARAVDRVGMGRLGLRHADRALVKRVAGLTLDLGGVGKGYAVDRMADILRDWGIESALVHAGASTVYAMGCPPGEGGSAGWPVALRDPRNEADSLRTVLLRERAMSGSGQGRHGRHIVDPSVGLPPPPSLLGTWATASSAAVADALSTAFLLMAAELPDFCRRHPRIGAAAQTKDQLVFFGSWTFQGEPR